MTTIDVSLFMSAKAYQDSHVSYIDSARPQKVIQAHVENAIEHQGYSHNVTVSNDYSFDTGDYDDTNSDLVELRDKYWAPNWLGNHKDKSEHSNFLILAKNEWPNPDGARAVATWCYPGDGNGRRAVFLNGVKAGLHSKSPDPSGAAGDDVEGTIRGAIHEIGHNVGQSHGDGLRYVMAPHTDQETTKATPMGCAAGSTNNCGEDCTTNPTEEWDHYYGSCEMDYPCL